MKPIVFKEVAKLFENEEYKLIQITQNENGAFFEFKYIFDTDRLDIRFTVSKDNEFKGALKILKENGYVE